MKKEEPLPFRVLGGIINLLKLIFYRVFFGARDLFRLFLYLIESCAALFFYRLQLLRLGFERRRAGKRDPRARRVMATACWAFPVYSHTFVYQELTQMIRHGFDLRFLYFHLDLRQRLASQFQPLRRVRRRVILHPSVCKRAFSFYERRNPAKVDRLVDMLSEASGVSPGELKGLDHFLQAFSFSRVVEAYRPDYLHSYFFYEGTLYSLVAPYLLSIPRGVSCYADHLLKDYPLKLVPLHLDQCAIVIATSERIRKELLEIAPQADPGRIIVKPNAIDATRFPTVPRSDPEGGEPFRLVCLSRIEPKKGLAYLVEAVRILRDRGLKVEAHLIGGVDESESSLSCARDLERRIEELRLNGKVHLEGPQGEYGIKRLFGRSHLFVAPFIETETGDKDGIPTSLLEAMASGLPVVATDAGSIREVVDDGRDGIVVRQRDAKAIAAAVADLIADKETRGRLGERGADKVRAAFDVTVCEHLFHDRLTRLLEKERQATA